MNVRRALASDIPALAAIELEHPGFPAWGEKGLAAELSNRNSVTLVAEEAGRPAAFVNFWIVRPQVQLNSVAVSRSALRRGLASRLLAKLEEYAKKNLCREIDLEVSERNSAAVAFYAARGFSVCGRRPKFYNNTDDALLMRKSLVPENR